MSNKACKPRLNKVVNKISHDDNDMVDKRINRVKKKIKKNRYKEIKKRDILDKIHNKIDTINKINKQ